MLNLVYRHLSDIFFVAFFKNIAIQVQNNALIINTFVGFDNNELHVTTSATV